MFKILLKPFSKRQSILNILRIWLICLQISRSFSFRSLQSWLRSHISQNPFGISSCIATGRRLSWPLAGNSQGLMFCYRPQTKFAKVMFSQVSVCPRGACVVGYAWQGEGGMRGRGGHVWQGGVCGRADVHGWGVCMAGGACVVGRTCAVEGGMCAWQERRPL